MTWKNIVKQKDTWFTCDQCGDKYDPKSINWPNIFICEECWRKNNEIPYDKGE